jgi:hypothetical protein
MLSPVYGERYKATNELFNANVVDVASGFNNLNIVLMRTKRYNQNGRNETEDEAREVDKAITDTLKRYKMNWHEVPGNFEGINKIVKKIMSKEQEFKISI